MNYALSSTPNSSAEEIANNAADAPRAMMDASTGAMAGSFRPKGLILTKEQIVDLYLYEQKGLHLPTDAADVSVYLGYDQSTSPGRGLTVNDFVVTFSTIKSHARQWDGLRQRIKLISTELKIFAGSVINTEEHVTKALSKIEALNVLKEFGIRTLQDLRRVEEEMGDKFPGVELKESDSDAVATVSGLLDRLLSKISDEAVRTDKLKKDLEGFGEELAVSVRPEINARLTAIENNTFKDDVLRLQKEIEALDTEIDEKNASYKKMVMDSLGSASSLNLVGLGMAIYIGVEAEKVRKERNTLKAQRNEKNVQMGKKSTVLKRLNQVKADLQDMEFLSLEADAATQNLVTVWNSLNLYVKTSKKQSDAITDALDLSFLAYHLDEVVTPWHDILVQADELHDVFDEAEKEIKKLSIPA